MTIETTITCDVVSCERRLPWPPDAHEGVRTAAMSQWVRVTLTSYPFVHETTRHLCTPAHYTRYLVELASG